MILKTFPFDKFKNELLVKQTCIYVDSVTFFRIDNPILVLEVSRNNHFIKSSFTNGQKFPIHKQGHHVEKFKSAFGVKFNLYLYNEWVLLCHWAGLSLIDSLKTCNLKLTHAN